MRNNMRKCLCTITLLSLLFSSCSVGPKYASPCMEIPCDWNSELSDGMDTEKEMPDCFLWWESLNDPLLNSLVERAACQNLDLYIAAMRILEARTEEKGGTAALLPHLDATVNYDHAQYSQKTLNRILGDCCKDRGSSRKNINFFEIGFDAEWEIDLFGLHAHEIQALKAQIEASRQEYYYLWVTLAAEVAKNYIDLRSAQQHLKVIEHNISDQIDTLKLTRSLIQAGFAGTLDERQAQQQLSTLAAEKPQIKLSIDKAIHRLSILLGYAPGELFEELCEPLGLPLLPDYMPIGIPSELLRRRPDIRKAERDLAAATERVGSAVAALFPRLSLRGFVGEIGTFKSNGIAWFAGPQLLSPLFNSKALKQDVDFNKIKVREAFYQYQKTVLDALEEAENSIASFHFELERNRHLKDAQSTSREAYQSTDQLYKKGLKSYLEVLVLNRSRLAAEEAYLESLTELLYHYISLYKALGGGWN